MEIKHTGNLFIFYPPEKFTSNLSKLFSRIIQEIFSKHRVPLILINFDRVLSVGSFIVRDLYMIITSLDRENARLGVCSLGPDVLKTFEIMELLDRLAVYASEDDALLFLSASRVDQCMDITYSKSGGDAEVLK
jgi:anti-anti-sigma regulatory factor